ncbi:MAG: NAD-dependent epimerase/dehydratase family protein [Thermoleophilaceae bacterium]
MTTVLVTGATGFIGSHVARLLVERGDEVVLGVQADSPDTAIADVDAKRRRLEVRDRRSVRRALKGVERVFHCAGVTSVRPQDAELLFDVNVHGTKIVMEECLRAGVERVVYTSSAAVVGPAAPGKTADETQLFTAARLGIPYVNSVHEGEVEAMRVAAHGLPLVCLNPVACFGAGDHLLSSTRLVRSFLLGRIPVYMDGAASIVDVRDVAEGHLLADELGQVGERYILGGRNFTFDRLFADLGRLSGIDPPVKLPARVAEAAANVLGPGGRWPLTRSEVRAAAQWWTYRSTRARRELGWRPRPHEETLEATVTWHLEREHGRIARTRRSRQIQYRLAGVAMGAAESAVALVRSVPLGRKHSDRPSARGSGF